LHQSLSLFDEQHKVSLHPHQPLRRGRAVDAGRNSMATSGALIDLVSHCMKMPRNEVRYTWLRLER